MKIQGGSRRGRKLIAPKGDATRPLLARAKASMFDRLAPDLEGQVLLDLFAGSGALGIEALSRGARRVLFLEQAQPALEALRKNLSQLGFPQQSWRILRRDLLRADALLAVDEVFDAALLAPPFATLACFEQRPRFDALLNATIARLPAHGWAAVQFSTARAPLQLPAGAQERWRKRFGKSTLVCYQVAEEPGCV